MNFPKALDEAAGTHKFPLLFATVSGAHLYGFPSPDSDFDMRGVHILPVRELVGLDAPEETIEISEIRDGIELDLVTHDIKKFMGMMLKKNGYVLEQLHSPLIIRTCPEHEELKSIADDCVTKHHNHHYGGFANTQWNLFLKESPRRVKPLLYVFRVLLTGIHLMRTGKIEANLLTLNQDFALPYINDLVERKVSSKEKQTLPDAGIDFFSTEYTRLLNLLDEESARSQLPESPSARPALNDLLKRMRLSPA